MGAMANLFKIFRDAASGDYEAQVTDTVSVAPGTDEVEIVYSPAQTNAAFERGLKLLAEPRATTPAD
jgi:hypothetical protein